MQDTTTGRLHEIPAGFVNMPKESISDAMSAIIPKERQGATFQEGEKVNLKGGDFVIRKIIKKGLVLHGLPKSST